MDFRQVKFVETLKNHFSRIQKADNGDRVNVLALVEQISNLPILRTEKSMGTFSFYIQ